MGKADKWEVIWKEEAKEDLRKIKQTDPSVAKEIKRKIDRYLATNPKKNGVKMREVEWEDYYRYNVFATQCYIYDFNVNLLEVAVLSFLNNFFNFW